MNNRSRPIWMLFFWFCLSAVGLTTALAQTNRADQLRQTLSPKSEAGKSDPSQPMPSAENPPLAKTGFALEDGTVVKLKLMRDLFSSKLKDEETIDFEVIEDVMLDGLVVIPQGTKAQGTVIEAQAAKRMGRTGRIGVRLDYAFLANGKRISMRAIAARSDGGRSTQVAENTFVAATYFFPIAPFFLLQKGKEVTIPKGTLVTSFVDGDHPLDREAFSPPPASRPPDGPSQQQR